MKKLIGSALIALPCLVTGTAAIAQTNTDAEDTAVLDRARPDYDALGIPVSSFLLFPKLTVNGNYDDNILAQSTSTKQDFFTQIQPSLALQSQWPRHEFDLNGHASINRYAQYTSENTNDYGGAANGRLDILDSAQINAGGSYDLATLPRQSEYVINDTVHPVQYGASTATASASNQFSNVKITLSGGWNDYAYQNGVDSLGNIVDERSLDYQYGNESVRADYSLSPDTGFFVNARLTQIDYLHDLALDRNGNGAEILGGVTFHLTHLFEGELSTGYIEERYGNVSNQDYSNFALHGSLRWFLTQLTTVTFKADRTVDASADPLSAGYVDTSGGVQIDHELRRNIILTGLFNYENDSYQGIDRQDHRWNAGVSATYLLNRSLGLDLKFDHQSQVSDGAERYINYDINMVGLSVVLQK
jgi:hypothetical protein